MHRALWISVTAGSLILMGNTWHGDDSEEDWPFFEWKLVVTSPGGKAELFHVDLDGGSVKLETRDWKCTYGKTSRMVSSVGDCGESVELTCIYRAKVVASTSASCSFNSQRSKAPDSDRATLNLAILDNQGRTIEKESLQVGLKCLVGHI